jgi:hypothetical protein
MNPPAPGTKFLGDPAFWEKYSGFFFDKEKLLEFAEAIGVSAEFIQEKGREQLQRFIVRRTAHLIPGNRTIH